MLAICDFDMRFTFVVVGWSGSAYDTRVLNHALTNFPSFPSPKGKLIINSWYQYCYVSFFFQC
jgi:hypothetical protein